MIAPGDKPRHRLRGAAGRDERWEVDPTPMSKLAAALAAGGGGERPMSGSESAVCRRGVTGLSAAQATGWARPIPSAAPVLVATLFGVAVSGLARAGPGARWPRRARLARVQGFIARARPCACFLGVRARGRL